MNIFLIGNPRSNNNLLQNLQILYEKISSLGHEHVNNFIKDKNNGFEEKMKRSKHSQQEFYKDMINSISKADICIFEASMPSFGIGYLVEKSLSLSKPTIVLFYKENSSFVLPYVENERLLTKIYTDKNLDKILKQSIILAKERRDKRFNFYLSTKLLEYVENLSKEEGVTKSKVMRDIILRDMRQKDTPR